MWLINFKTFLKQLINNKLHTLIVVLGFTFALTFVILLGVYLKNELSVNSKQENKERIYRLRNESFSGFAPPIGSWLQTELPQIESYTRVFTNTLLMKVRGNDDAVKFDCLMVDPDFFTIFTIPIIEGNKTNLLKTKQSVVLSKAFANKIFGSESPIGKQIKIDDRFDCTVAGVFDKLPEYTNFQEVDAILNFPLLADLWSYPELLTTNNNCSFDLYLLEKANANLPEKAPQIVEMFKKDFWLYKTDRVKEVIFDPLPELYFSKIQGRGTVHNSKTLISVLLAVVFLILGLSIINYMNLSIAQSGARAKDIAIRKLLGSSRSKLILQHITESVLLILVAFGFAVFLAFLFEGTFNNLLQTELRLTEVFTLPIFIVATFFIVLIGFVSGIIPALIITNFKAVDVIKGGFRRKNRAVYSRILIGFQYVVVIVLIISTIVISKQTIFMTNKDLGFNKENILRLPNYLDNNQRAGFKAELLKIPGVTDVSYVAGDPINGGNNNSFVYEDKPVSFQVFIVDSAFFRMTGIEITPTGVAYSKKGIWLNQTAVKKLGLDPLPKVFKVQEKSNPVLGVVNDFNFKSLNQKIGMLMIYQMNDNSYPWNILVKIDGSNVSGTLTKMEKVYNEFAPGVPIDFEFFDSTIADWYSKEKRTSGIIRYFAILSVIISIMGIFAMSIFYNQQKTKEIGVRKVNGATIFEIVKMLSKDFVKWILVAFVIAVPIAYYAMQKWLESFAYKIDLSWWIFAVAGIFALLIALVTVSWNTLLAARRNPVEALRYE